MAPGKSIQQTHSHPLMPIRLNFLPMKNIPGRIVRGRMSFYMGGSIKELKKKKKKRPRTSVGRPGDGSKLQGTECPGVGYYGMKMPRSKHYLFLNCAIARLVLLQRAGQA